MEFLEEELLICLNFDDKIDQSFFKNPKIFFNAVNLDSQTPLIQIDKHVFQGSYEDSIGTNIFLEEIAEPRSVDKVFQIAAPMHLEYLNCSSKTLNLRSINVPEEVQTLSDSECVDVRFLEDYQTVLDKIELGTLNIQDAITKMAIEKQKNTKQEILTEDSMQGVVESSIESGHETTAKPKDLIANHDLLKHLIQPITKKDCDSSCDILHDQLFNVENCTSFFILKQLYVNHLNKSTNISKVGSLNQANIFSLVNIDKSIEDGIIIKPTTNGELSDSDKQALISLQNFDNLSLSGKFVVLSEYLSESKKHLQRSAPEELNAIDEFNRTPKQRYKLLKSLTRDIEYILLKQCTLLAR